MAKNNSAKTDSANSDPALQVEPGEELLDSVAATMARIGLADPTEPENEPETKPETIIDPEPDPTPEPPAEPASESKPEPSTEPESEKTSDPVLPDAYRRAAIHTEWTPEDVDIFFKSDPVLAMKTFESIHKSMNEQSRGWANLGQAQREAETSVPTPDPAPISTVPAVTKIDLSKLEEDYADDPMLDVVTKLASQLDELRSQPQIIPEPTISTKDRETTTREVHQFFADPALMTDPEFYGRGKEVGDLTPNQKANRDKVLVTGDQLIAGNIAQGKELSNVKALTLAHLLETAPSMKVETAAGIKKTLTQREQNIDFKPSSSQPVNPENPKDGDKALLERTKIRLKKVFGK